MVRSNLLKRQFERDGFLVLKNVFTRKVADNIISEANKLYELPEVKNSYMKYFENSSDNSSKILARMENFINDSNMVDFKEFISNEVTPIVEEVLESRVNLFKDKINWKLPGGGAFKPHQDFEAWSDFPPTYYVTCAILVDECTFENGCLEMVSESHKNGVLKNENGCLNEELVNSMNWEPIFGNSRDLVIFDSFVPHRSGMNMSTKSRRVFYFTYNLRDEGDFYQAYFEKKRTEFPPDFDRDDKTEINLNSKYNLANPIK